MYGASMGHDLQYIMTTSVLVYLLFDGEILNIVEFWQMIHSIVQVEIDHYFQVELLLNKEKKPQILCSMCLCIVTVSLIILNIYSILNESSKSPTLNINFYYFILLMIYLFRKKYFSRKQQQNI